MRKLFALLSILACLTSHSAAAATRSEALSQAVGGFIQPAFAQLERAAAQLGDATSLLCASPGPNELAITRGAFKAVVLDYGRVEFLRFGPLTEDNRSERMLFWPDRKGIALRQVQAILAEQDERATTLAGLRAKSIAVQGLGALDYALFGEGADALAGKGGAFRCAYAATVAAAVAATTNELSAAWSAAGGIAARLAEPQANQTDYRSEREALEELVGAMAQGIEILRDTRLLPFVGRNQEDPKPKSALFWRSGMTMPMIRAGFEGIRDFLVVSQIGQLAAEPDLWVGNSAQFELANALKAAELVTDPIAEALVDEKQRRALAYLIILTGSLQTLLGENLPAALGLSVGFSSLDGD